MINYSMNFFLIVRNIMFSFKAAKPRRTRGGKVSEFAKAATGFTTWPFFIDSSDKKWTPNAIKKLLKSKGISSGGWGYSRGKFMFRVRRGQAAWAESLMLKNGVPVRGKLIGRGR